MGVTATFHGVPVSFSMPICVSQFAPSTSAWLWRGSITAVVCTLAASLLAPIGLIAPSLLGARSVSAR
jgi:hypothetical protein